MPRPVGHGRPGTTVIPAQWTGTHEQVAAATHGAAINLHRGPSTRPGFNWDTASARPTPGAAYATNVHADITAERSRADTDLTTGEELIETADYRVAVSNHLTCLEGDLVEVLSAPSDPLLAARWMRVDQVLLGSNRFERDLACVLLPLAT